MKGKLRLVIVNRHPSDVLGGSEIQCDNIAAALQQKGHDVFYIAPAGNPAKNYAVNYSVIPVASTGKAIAEAVIKVAPDIVYWRFNKYCFYSAARRIAAKKTPIVFALSHINDTRRWSYLVNPRRGLMHALKAVKQGLQNVWNHRGFRFVSGISSLNPEFLQRLSVSKQRFIPNSITTNTVGFDWDKPFVCWVSNIKPAKRPELFVELAKACANTPIDFLLVGKIQSTDYQWLRDIHRQVPNCHYLGPKTVEEVNGLVEKSLLLVHTCKPEGFGNIFIQAWLKGVPTLSYEFDPGNFIANQKLGYVGKGDWPLFSQQARHLLGNPEERNTMGQRAREFALTEFSIAKTADALEAFLYEVLE